MALAHKDIPSGFLKPETHSLPLASGIWGEWADSLCWAKMLRSCPLLFPATVLKFLFMCSFPSLRLEPAWDPGLHRNWDLQPDCVTILRHISWRLFFCVKPLFMLIAFRWRFFPVAALFPWSSSGSVTFTRSDVQLLNKGEEKLVSV